MLKIILGAILLIALFLIINYPVRLQLLKWRSADLIKTSDGFPTEYFVGNPEDAKSTYVALGDSTAVGTGATDYKETYPYQVATAIADQGKYVEVKNLGINGAKYEDIIQVQLPALNKLQPDYITLSAGANDTTHHTDFARYQDQLVTVSKALAEFPNTKILLANTPSMEMVPAFPYPYPDKVGARADRQNSVLQKTSFPANVIIVDLHDGGRLDPDKSADYYARDLFHPSDEGYSKWAEVFITTLLQ